MELTETDRNDFKNLVQKMRRYSEKRQERRIKQEEVREKEREKEKWRQIREAAKQVDTLVMDAGVMQTWRKRVRETLDSSRGIKTAEDLLAALADERRNIGAFYTVLAFCHDDMFWGGVAPIITDDIRSLNPQLCSRPRMVGVYYPRQRWMLLDIYLRHVMRDLGVFTPDLGAEGEPQNSKAAETGHNGKPGKTTKRVGKRGRPKVGEEEAEKRRKLKADWERYKETGPDGTKERFCEDERITVEYLNNSVLRWCRDHPR